VSTVGSGHAVLAPSYAITPASCQVAPGACVDIEAAIQHTAGTAYTDCALGVSDSSGNQINYRLATQDNSVTNKGFAMRFCNTPGSQTSNIEWFNSFFNGSGYQFVNQGSSTATMFTSSTLSTSGSAILNLTFYFGPSSATTSCSFSASGSTPLTCSTTSWPGTESDQFTINYLRSVLVPAL
jgi:hypothetical protein